MPLREGWRIQSSLHVGDAGAAVSMPGYDDSGWYPATVPTTVLAALVDNGAYADPYVGMNLRSIPGTDYPQGKNFSNLPMSPSNPFRLPWWYRTEFEVPAAYQGKTVWLHFEGINYRADIWMNGRRIAKKTEVAGAFRIYEFDVTEFVHAGALNALAVEVFAPRPDDLAITWVDWNPAPPDKNMGLYREAYLAASGPVALRYPHVVTRLELPSGDAAHLTVVAELRNAANRPVKGTLSGRIGEIRFSRQVTLKPRENRTVAFTPDEFPQLSIEQPRLWWPAQLGPQNLYSLEMEFTVGGTVSDRAAIRFGIRQVTSELTAEGHLLYRINGKRILIRGAGWAPDMLLRTDPERQRIEIGYARDLNLNAIRLEGKLEDENFLRLADEAGMLLMPGWCCCDHWEKWQNWKKEDYEIAARSLRDQIRRLRSHPSVFTWLNGSDYAPPPEVERTYLRILKEQFWPNPVQASATATPSKVTGPTGVKMRGPYLFIEPSYWYRDTRRGGAFGFNTETGPGAAVPVIESLRQMLPARHLWPIDEHWDYHCRSDTEYPDLRVFNEALAARYGPPKGLEDYVWKAQVQAYEGHRAMFEAYRRNKYTSTGVIQWMLNSAWPSMYWQLYDYYLRPGGSYYGARKGNEPLHIQYSYDDRSVVVVNAYYEGFEGLRAEAAIYDLEMNERFRKQTTLDAVPDSSTQLFTIPEIGDLSSTYFLLLRLEDASGKPVSRNFYWLSTKPEAFDWEKSHFWRTPMKSFVDLTGLEQLPEVELLAEHTIEAAGENEIARIRLRNPSPHLAFFVRLRITKGPGGDDLLPVVWEDNFISLLPGETRELTATYRRQDLALPPPEGLGEPEALGPRKREGHFRPVIVVSGWNVLPRSLP